ncbi:hypothetical protein T4B_1942, partial [Trichinella pseudospiralis]
RTFYDATTCYVCQANKCPITDDKAPLGRSARDKFQGLELSDDLLLIGHFICGTWKNNFKKKNHIKHILESFAEVSLLTTLCHNAYINTQESSNAETEAGCFHFSLENILDILV